MVAFDSLTIAAVVGGSVGLLGLTLGLYLQETRRRRDEERIQAALSVERESLERHIYRLNEQLAAHREHWQDLNHLLLSAPKAGADSRTVPVTPFLVQAGLNPSDLSQDKNLVFLLTPFHKDMRPTYLAVQKACADVGMRCARGDEIFVPGEVFSHILRQIVRARVVVANIDGRNANVFYELGIAQALGKPVILISKSLHEVPFDISGQRVIIYKDSTELIFRLTTALRQYAVTTANSITEN